jgi:hypothetical protein
MKRSVISSFLILALLFSFLLPSSAFAEKDPRPVLYTYYRQMGWGDRIELAYVDSDGDLWALNGYDANLHWPYKAEEQLQFLEENKFENIGKLKHDDLFDLTSLVNSVTESDAPSHPAACDAGTERTYAVQYDRDGNAKAVLLGMSGDDWFENEDPNAQGLYLAARRLFPHVTCYGGLMGPVGFIPVSIVNFCKLGDLTGATVKACFIDCESGPSEISLSRKDQAQILYDVQNCIVTGKVSAADTTGGYRDYSFFQGDKYLGGISIYEGLLYCSDGMYSIERKS